MKNKTAEQYSASIDGPGIPIDSLDEVKDNRAPEEKNVPDGNEVRKRDQEYSEDNWNEGVKALGPNPNSILKEREGDFFKTHDLSVDQFNGKLKQIGKKIDVIDAKIEFLLKYLEL